MNAGRVLLFVFGVAIAGAGCRPTATVLAHQSPKIPQARANAASSQASAPGARPVGILLRQSADPAAPARPLQASAVMQLSFPTAMAAPADFEKPSVIAPVVFTPAVPLQFVWKSATEGELTLHGPLPPDTPHRLELRPNLRDLVGEPVAAPGWSAAWPAAPFRAFTPGSRRADEVLSSRPTIALEFTHPVAAAEVARTARLRDESGAAVDCEIALAATADAQAAYLFNLTPLAPLAAAHAYELVVEDTRCALGGARLPFVHVLPVGTTRALGVTYVRARHQPMAGAFLDIGFDQPIDRVHGLAASGVRITPAVALGEIELRGREARLFGAFQRGVRYEVAIARDAARNREGFGLPEPAVWHATFGAKRAAVILERSIVTTPAAHGLDVEFTQVNTGRLRWQLARLPVEHLPAVHRRLDEYRALDRERRDPATGEFPLMPTALLVADLQLPVVASGEYGASDADVEVARTLTFTAEQMVGGAYLLEISGAAPDGRIAGNRALFLVNREFLVWKRGRDMPHGRLFDVSTALPVAGARVRVLSTAGDIVTEATTDSEGTFAPQVFKKGASDIVLVERDGGCSAHFVALAGDIPTAERFARTTASRRHWLFTDRGIYRPGETLHLKGIVRQAQADALSLPAPGQSIAWEIHGRGTHEPVLRGERPLSNTGAWDAEIALPVSLPLGHYTAVVPGTTCAFKVDEFRAPAFAVELQAPEIATDRTSRVRVVSHYLHGAPNARALVRWRAVWTAYAPYPEFIDRNVYLNTNDHHSPGLEPRRPDASWRRTDRAGPESGERTAVLDGTAVLDAKGIVDLACMVPFAASARRAAAHVNWEISVTAPDGQTVSAAGTQCMALAPAQPAVALSSEGAGAVKLTATAVDLPGKPKSGMPLTVSVHHVAEKTVRELVSDRIVRYRNTTIATPVFTRNVTAPYQETIPVTRTGRYVAVVELAGVEHSPRASDDTTVTGEARAEFARWDDTSLSLEADRPRYDVGETARIAVRAPFAGRAWVTVETDRVLASYDVVLSGNAASINVPITADMHPNAFVAVHLVRPATADQTPTERIGVCNLDVRRPEVELNVAVAVDTPTAEPGAMVEGTVTVTTCGKAAASAALTLFAVDDAILRYGHWRLPDPFAAFYPVRWHEVVTSSGLQQFMPRSPDSPLFQKGFLIGDGSLGWRSRYVRSRFLPLALWQAEVRADANGKARFAFPAPDNLTVYRIVAVAHHGTDAFGHGAAQMRVARTLQAEPALPRFVRAGDEVDLRVVLRQGEWAELPVEVSCVVEGATLTTAGTTARTLMRALPEPVAFRARIAAEGSALSVRFSVRATQGRAIEDTVQVELPVRPTRILRTEAVAGTLPASGWAPATALPATWREAQGEVDLVLSSSPWLPLLEGIPRVLEYPHGCVEQLSGRVLVYALMADLLRGLPDGEARAPEYKRRVEDGLARLTRAQLPDGTMPYWPGTRHVHPFATIQTAWAVTEAQRSGWSTPPQVSQRLRAALLRIVRQQDGVREGPAVRAFALMVAAAMELNPKPRIEALELYQQRDALGDDGRAFLALALHELQILPDEKRQLIAELDPEPAERAFEPTTFGSTNRTAALRLCARSTVAARPWAPHERAQQQRALETLMCSSHHFSTQENLWLLLAFRALVRRDARTDAAAWQPTLPEVSRSADGHAVGWYTQSLATFASRFSNPITAPPGAGTYLLRARYRTTGPETRVDQGFRIERIVRNLTAADRDGSAGAPFQLGDELAVTFRTLTQHRHAYVALEEALPGAFETVDPAYYRLAHREKLAALDVQGELALSHWEKRDDRTLWYFDRFDAGTASHTSIVRVTSAGRFHWPGATIAPMYDHRFSGVTESRLIEVR